IDLQPPRGAGVPLMIPHVPVRASDASPISPKRSALLGALGGLGVHPPLCCRSIPINVPSCPAMSRVPRLSPAHLHTIFSYLLRVSSSRSPFATFAIPLFHLPRALAKQKPHPPLKNTVSPRKPCPKEVEKRTETTEKRTGKTRKRTETTRK